jgi:hypothetical protein
MLYSVTQIEWADGPCFKGASGFVVALVARSSLHTFILHGFKRLLWGCLQFIASSSILIVMR